MLFERPISSGSMPRVLAAKIICGDCCGDDLLPVKTNLTTAGVCDQCGGCSYEFASRIGDALANYLRNSTEKHNHVISKTKRGPQSEPRITTHKFRVIGKRA